MKWRAVLLRFQSNMNAAKNFFHRLSHLAVVFFAGLLLSGCVSDVANRYYGEITYPEKNVKEVELLQKKPDRSFTVIADFQSRGETRDTLRRKAAKIGADAIIVTMLGGYYDLSEQWAGQDKNNTYSRIIGTAIKYNP
jgi:hypothetical protein